jgi:putative transposase
VCYDTAILAKIHERIANRRSDFAQKRSRELNDRYQVIVFEALAPQEMGKSRGMRKSIMDVAWSQFISVTVGKAAEAGRTVIVVDPAIHPSDARAAANWLSRG